jgi:arylformamidase
MVIDLSHVIEPGMPAYPGLPEPKFRTFLAHGNAARHAQYAPGVTFQIAAYDFGGNTGTYVDAPFHRHPNGADLADVPLDRLADLPGVLIGAHEDGPIGPETFRSFDLRGRAVLLYTGWSRRWGGDYFRSGPYLTGEACDALASAGAALIGIDCANIDNMQDPARPAHTRLLGAGIPIVEHLTNLNAIAGRAFRFSAAPPAIRGGTSFPVRALAVCE